MTLSRMLLATLVMVAAAAAQPPLTTIQDLLYKADGTPFNGIAMISWPSFEAPDLSEIAGQTITVKIENGNFRVQLVPNAATSPLVFYTVVYNSDGRTQFNESWAVPASNAPLRIRDVRVVLPVISSSSSDTNAAGPVNESDVIGLLADLGARPTKGPAYSAGHVALVNTLGSLDSVAGNPGDCVHVDGSAGSCGGSASPGFTDQEVPAGVINGVNATFTLANIPNPPASLALYRNGLLMEAGVDYTLTSQTIQFQTASIPVTGDALLATYRVGASASPLLVGGPQVLCSQTGASVTGTSFASMGACVIPSGTLQSGDRVAIRFDLQHQGTVSGYTFLVKWGGTTVLQRVGSANDGQVTGRVDAGLDMSGAQVSTESWGTTLTLLATISNATDAYASGLTVDFQGELTATGDTLTLRNYSLVRVP